MLEPPDVPDASIVARLRSDFSPDIHGITFLPIGADGDTAVYQANAGNDTRYFVKLRRGEMASASVEIALALHAAGVEQVIPPLQMATGAYFSGIDGFTLSVSPFIDGSDGITRKLTGSNLIDLGRSLRAIHTSTLPGTLTAGLPVEGYDSYWRDRTRSFQSMAVDRELPDKAAECVAALMRKHATVLDELLAHAERIGKILRGRDIANVPCHADIHAGNVLVDQQGQLFVVDWDTFMLAPKERDLMFIGGGISSDWRGNRHEQFVYRGYGPVEIDRTIIAYYRCERIIQDVAAYCDQLFLTSAGGNDREQSIRYFASNFEPASTIAIALDSVRKARS